MRWLHIGASERLFRQLSGPKVKTPAPFRDESYYYSRGTTLLPALGGLSDEYDLVSQAYTRAPDNGGRGRLP